MVFPTDDAIMPARALDMACLFSLCLDIFNSIIYKSDVLIINQKVLNIIDSLLNLIFSSPVLALLNWLNRQVALDYRDELLLLRFC